MTADRPLISVVIPTRDNHKALELTLDSIGRTDMDLSRVEVVVVDDGSSDNTYMRFRDRAFPFSFKIYREDYSNQSASTNAAILRSTGEFVLCSAQDIIFHENLLSQHLRWHQRFQGEDVMVLGYLPYASSIPLSPFMCYMVKSGFQFRYYMIKDPLRVAPNFAYAPNLSLRREVLDRVGLFDVQFPFGCQDTDLGIRMVRDGVRIVYNKDAIGFHNHPAELGQSFGRLERAGSAEVRLREKHPDHEGGPRAWDLLLQGYLAYPRVQYDRDLQRSETLEARVLSDHPDFDALWSEAFLARRPLDAFNPHQRRGLETLRALFDSYGRLLQFHWGKGFLGEALKVLGARRVSEIVGARLDKAQSSMQCRRTLQSKLLSHGLLTRTICSPRDYLNSSVVYGFDDYDQAARYIETYLLPETAIGNQQILLVVEQAHFSAADVERLEEAAQVIVCEDTDSGVLAAIAAAEADIITVTSGKVSIPDVKSRVVSELIFDRFPHVSVLGGCVRDSGGGTLRYGYSFGAEGEGSARALQCSPDDVHGLLPIDAAISEFCVIRKSAAREILDQVGAEGGEVPRGWNFDLCRRAARRGGLTYHVPDLEASRDDQLRVRV